MNKENINKKHILLIFLLSALTFGSLFFLLNTKDKFVVKDCPIEISRFEKDFFSIPPDSFETHFYQVRNRYPAFFSDTSLAVNRDIFFNDSLRSILDSVNLIFDERIPKIEDLKEGFCNYADYFPESLISLYTFIDKEFDYRTPVVFADDKLLFASPTTINPTIPKI